MADKNVTQAFKPNTYHTTKIGLGWMVDRNFM